MNRQGIDVSRWQGDISWPKVAKCKDFAILRCTSGRSNALDSKFMANLRGCEANGVPVGVYRYSYALTVAEAKEEARAVVDAIRGHQMPCGVWYDAEDTSQRALSKAKLTAIIRAFQAVVEAAGYSFGIYCNQDWYINVLDVDAFDCSFWVARYGGNDGQMHTKPRVHHDLWGWQYTSKGKVNGISGNVDLDMMYADIGSSSNAAPAQKVTEDTAKTDYAESFDKAYAGSYTTKAALHLRAGAGTSKQSIVVLPKGTAVRSYGYYTRQTDGTVWLYVVAVVGNKKYIGFCSRNYLGKA